MLLMLWPAEYGEELLEPQLRPVYLKKLEKIRKGKYYEFKDIGDLKKSMN